MARPDPGRKYVFTEADSSVRIDLPDDRGALAWAIDVTPRHGTIAAIGTAWIYSPEPAFRGADFVSWRRSDGAELGVGVTVDRIPVQARRETEPIAAAGDNADDIAVWVPPEDPAASLIVGTNNKRGLQGGISLYDLSGREVASRRGKRINNVDVRYGFPLRNEAIDLIVASNRSSQTVSILGIAPPHRLTLLTEDANGIPVDFLDEASNRAGVYGICMYLSPTSGKFFAFVTCKTGFVSQIELYESSSRPGSITGRVVRTFDVNPGAGNGHDNLFYVEGCVADDFHRALYLAEENFGIWRYGAEPDAGTARHLVDRTGAPGYLVEHGDVEGLAIYHATAETGYLIASNQGDNAYNVYERTGDNAFVTRFEIVAGPNTDATTDTDGIEVISMGLGGEFASGIFVAQDDVNTPPGTSGNQDFKLVSWGDIATAIEPNLSIRTDWSPRSAPD